MKKIRCHFVYEISHEAILEVMGQSFSKVKLIKVNTAAPLATAMSSIFRVPKDEA